ncbi:hypothetical protein I4U23_004551 [Adineta vaga]|nr:hypothetical protein I4U23_004551 [Adineta vaga]
MVLELIDSCTCSKSRKAVGLIYAQHQCEISKSTCKEQILAASQDNTSDHQFSLSDDLQEFFQNEMQARYVDSSESDLSVARSFIEQMVNDDPFYIADVSHCAKQYMKWNYYLPRVKTFYAVKTNFNSFIIRVIEKIGGGFDCASMEELRTVLSICPDIDCSQRIIYSHPCKPISHINYFKDQNVQLTVADNIHELIKIKEYWPNVKVLVRLKTNDSSSLIPLSTKFGVNKRVAICMLASAAKLKVNVVGCAFHVGTGCYDETAFKHALEFAKWFFDIADKSEHVLPFKFLDIGGGFPGVDEEGKPSFSKLARTINQTLDELFPESTGIQIIAEPGRFYAAASMNLVTSIIGLRLNNKNYSDCSTTNQNIALDVKFSENAEIFYYVNDGIFGSFANILYEKAVYHVDCLQMYGIECSQSSTTLYNSAVFGPTCDSSDCLSPSVDLPLMNIGDYFLFYYVGAYSSSASTNFNGFNTKKYFYIWKN